jgi:hypothetical protein
MVLWTSTTDSNESRRRQAPLRARKRRHGSKESQALEF